MFEDKINISCLGNTINFTLRKQIAHVYLGIHKLLHKQVLLTKLWITEK